MWGSGRPGGTNGGGGCARARAETATGSPNAPPTTPPTPHTHHTHTPTHTHLPPRRIAAQNARLEAVAALLAAGSSVDLANKDNVTPLSVAVQLGHTEVAAALLKGKADPKRAPTAKPAERSPLDLMMLSVANNTCLRCKEENARYKCRRCGMARYCRAEVGQGVHTAMAFHRPTPHSPYRPCLFAHWPSPLTSLTYHIPPTTAPLPASAKSSTTLPTSRRASSRRRASRRWRSTARRQSRQRGSEGRALGPRRGHVDVRSEGRG